MPGNAMHFICQVTEHDAIWCMQQAAPSQPTFILATTHQPVDALPSAVTAFFSGPASSSSVGGMRMLPGQSQHAVISMPTPCAAAWEEALARAGQMLSSSAATAG